MAAFVAINYLDPFSDATITAGSSIKLSDIAVPLSIIFVMLVAYSLYYLYKMIRNPKKMPRWCWLMTFLFFILTATYNCKQIRDYITHPGLCMDGIYSVEIEGEKLKIQTNNESRYVNVGETIQIHMDYVGTCNYTYLGKGGNKLKFRRQCPNEFLGQTDDEIFIKPYTLKQYRKWRGN